jgi:hypothetical protein
MVVLAGVLAGCSSASGTPPPAGQPWFRQRRRRLLARWAVPLEGVPSAQDPPTTAQPPVPVPVPVPVRVPAQRSGQVVRRIPTRQRVVFLGVDDG